MKKIYYFTNSYPYDIGEQWKTNELNILKEKFKITVVPFFSHTKKGATEFINGISYKTPLFESLPYVSIKRRLLKIVLSKFCFLFLKEFFNKQVYRNKANFIQWISASYKILSLSKNERLNSILKKADDNIIFYFFWGKETSEIIPILKTKAKIVVRFHGYDLYEERNYNYIPYRGLQLKKIHTALFVSEQGQEYLKNRYRNIKFRTQLLRLGTVGEGKSIISNDNALRIFSCSSVVPLKRVDLIARTIIRIDFPVIWTHIGGGGGINDIKRIVKNAQSNVKINLVGQVNSKDVKSYYTNNFADIFINVSTTEGVPVSIMEALSASIPILATDVGGTSELVDESIGTLLPANLSEEQLLSEIIKFYNYPKQKKNKLRENAYQRYKDMCNAKILAENLSNYLDSI